MELNPHLIKRSMEAIIKESNIIFDDKSLTSICILNQIQENNSFKIFLIIVYLSSNTLYEFYTCIDLENIFQ